MRVLENGNTFDVISEEGSLVASFTKYSDADYFAKMRGLNPQKFQVGDQISYESDIIGQGGIFTITKVKVTDTGKILYMMDGKKTGMFYSDSFMNKI